MVRGQGAMAQIGVRRKAGWMHGVGKWGKLGAHCHLPLLSFVDFRHDGENGKHFRANFAIMAKMANIFPPFFAILAIFCHSPHQFSRHFRHCYYFSPKIDVKMAMSPPQSLKSRRGWGNSLIEVWMNWKPVGEGKVWSEYGRWMAIGEGKGWEDRPRWLKA